MVVVGDSRDERDEALGSLRILLFTGGPIALLLTALVGYGLTSAAMRPIDELVARLRRSVERERGFVASASHELRTPLALLKGELELALRAGRSPEELRAAIESAAEESDRLAQLAEDLLILARFDEGKLPVRREPLELGELLGTVAKRFESRARRAPEGGGPAGPDRRRRPPPPRAGAEQPRRQRASSRGRGGEPRPAPGRTASSIWR